MNELYTHQRFIMMGLDPIHVGAGGYRLGRVDNTIVREPGTNLPKIPGTSIAGTTRSYASMRYGNLSAAGRHQKYEGDKNKCPIIYTFGTETGPGDGQAGKVSIGDARILLFPVSSMAGPIWISTKEILEEASVMVSNSNVGDDTAISNLTWDKDNINIGWLMLKHNSSLSITPPAYLKNSKEWGMVENRIVIISQELFSQVVNSNLEVRTSVAINPETGAAEDKALFTYEALPRATWLWCDVVEDDYLNSFPKTEKQFKDGVENNGEPLGEEWNRPLDVFNAGFKLIEYLGIGGMGTRGFGRMKLICDLEVGTNES